VIRRLIVPALLVALLAGCTGNRYERYEGRTMGTSYRVTARCEATVPQAAIDDELAAVNAQMSSWLDDSELSRFKAAAPAGWQAVSPALALVVATAHDIAERSSGALDVTVAPLVNLWGFGPDGRPAAPPTESALAEARARTGWRRLEVRQQPPALKKRGPLTVDLSAVAKGHGVDRVAGLLEERGCSDYLVDIGGELRGRGSSPRGRAWRVGVEVPDPASLGAVQRVLRLEDGGLATSGDYRNFIDFDIGRLSHTIDPRSGRPVTHALASVTVAHESALWADGWATALLVLGPEHGWALAREQGLAALFIERTAEGFVERYTAAFKPLLTGAP